MDSFKVLWYDIDGNLHDEFDGFMSNIDRVRGAIQRLVYSPGSFVVREVIVIDPDDYTVFHAKGGKVIFPAENEVTSA